MVRQFCLLLIIGALSLSACGSSKEGSPEPQTERAMLQATIDTLQATVDAADSTGAVTQPATTAVTQSQAAPTLSPTSLPEVSEANLVGSDEDVPGDLANRLVLFSSDSEAEGFWRLFVIKADGSGLIDILTATGLEGGRWQVVWSPHGYHFALVPSERDAEMAYVVHLSDDQVIDSIQISAGGNIQSASWSPDGYKLLLQTARKDEVRGGIWGDILVVAPTGQILAKPVVDIRWKDISAPGWSPDGKWIGFGSYCENEWGVCPTFVNLETAQYVDVLTSLGLWPAGPSYSSVDQLWAPDSTRILGFSIDENGQSRELYVIELLTAQTVQLLSPDLTAENQIVAGTAWSPDGTRIGFFVLKEYLGDGAWVGDLYVVNADGSGLTTVVKDLRPMGDIEFSPNGLYLAYCGSTQGDANYEVYVLNLDNNQVTNLSQHDAHDEGPHWSPDSSKIAFHSDRSGMKKLWIGDIKNGSVVKLTPFSAPTPGTTGYEWLPQWSNDGRYILFQTDIEGNSEVYVADLNNMSVANLTNRVMTQDAGAIWLLRR